MPNEQHFNLFSDQNLRRELHNKAAGILKCSQTADDAVQETYIKMVNYKTELKTQNDWVKLCKHILKCSVFDILRKNKSIQRVLEVHSQITTSKSSVNPHKQLEDKEAVVQMEELIAKISDERGEKMMWLRAEGYKYEKIAEKLGTSVGSATGQVARIRKKIKLNMEKKANMRAYYQEIERLLFKYWEAETSIEEERILEDFFTTKKIPSHLAKFAPIFQHSKIIREKASRQKVGQLLRICSLIVVFLLAAYISLPLQTMTSSKSVVTVHLDTESIHAQNSMVVNHKNADANMEMADLWVKYQ